MISLARGLSFNGLANAFKVLAINSGAHSNPIFAGDTVFAWSEVLDKADIDGRDDLGALRLRTVGTKDHPLADFPAHGCGRQVPSACDFGSGLLGVDAEIIQEIIPGKIKEASGGSNPGKLLPRTAGSAHLTPLGAGQAPFAR